MPVVYSQLNNSFNQNIIFNDSAVTGAITIANGGVVSEANTQIGMLLQGGAYNVTINGLLTATSTALGGRGLELGIPAGATPNQISTINIGSTGEISGAGSAITAFHAANITNSGTLQGNSGLYVAGGDVAYTIKNSGDITVDFGNSAVWTDGAGAHTINNSGQISGRVEGSFTAASIEMITNSGTIDGQIWVRGGNDVIANSGTIYDHVFLDAGDDRLTNTGVIWGDIVGGGNSDTITNNGTLNGNMFGGTGADTLSNSATINGNVNAETNNDVFTNTGIVTGWIFMGTGNDTLNGGSHAENVADERGTDVYALGDGVDNFDAVGAETATGDDTVNGGFDAGLNIAQGIYGDTYNASDATQSVTINLSTLAKVDDVSGLTLAASLVEGAETGNDSIIGFETVFSGAGNDVIIGNARDNFISGGAGNDHVFGGTGNDYVVGGEGADFISGGSGRDTLDASVDAAIDTIVYTSLSDSTATRSGRDTIKNFTDADRIDLSRLNVSSLHYMGTDASFDGTAGAVRALAISTGWRIELDSNGDRLADFSVQITDGNHAAVSNWADNFIF